MSIARQIADGLAVAHAKGIVHRDLKPENVMLAADGRSKILDFGLARQTLDEGPEGPMPQVRRPGRPSSDATGEGSILGTVGYMSPEQASGRPVDFRSDQFALGLIAYEMLTGRRAFARPTVAETLSAVIREEPVPLSSLRGGRPRAAPAPDRHAVSRSVPRIDSPPRESSPPALAALEAGSTAAGVVTHGAHRSAARSALARPAAAPRASPACRPRAGARGGGWMRFHAAPDAIRSLAVLPFENASGDPDAEYLGDGLTESLINQMSRVPSLKVMARATVFRFKGVADPQEAGRELGAGAVLTGSVARRGDRLLITAELVETSSGVRLWGERYDRPLADLLRVQDLIASDISDGLRLRLSERGEDDHRPPRHRGPRSLRPCPEGGLLPAPGNGGG